MPITRRKRANPPDQPENNNNHVADSAAQAGEPLPVEPASPTPAESEAPPAAPSVPERVEDAPPPPRFANPSMANGDRTEHPSPPHIESGRRTARGELFRRPPQPPPTSMPPLAPTTPQPGLQPPAREISLPLGNLLHLAYNPGYTGSDEARGKLLHQLAEESKAGGRARCWNCGSIAIAYDRWTTRSKTFGEVGIAFCEICGVWSVM
ncbi:MAG: hypothetical protein ACRDIV_09905 [Ktedonobacteraceae bacterium]